MPNTKCNCGNSLHDGPCYEVNALSEADARTWERLLSMTPEQRAGIVKLWSLYSEKE